MNMITKTKTDLLFFEPHPLLPGSDLQTIIGYYWPGPKELKPSLIHKVDLKDGDQLALCENRTTRKAAFKKAILLMHGLGGGDSSPYMVRIAHLFKNRGWLTFRMNHRGAGNGEGLAKGLYHSGKSEDISAVLKKIENLYPEVPLVAVGFSLSGNALLKLLGQKKEPVPDNLKGAVAVTPPIELSKCAAAICRKRNWPYDRRFVRMLKAAVHQRQEQFSDFPKFDFPSNMNVRDFDEIYTAPLNNFGSAEDYYEKCSAKQFLHHINLPTAILASKNDPFIPIETFDGIVENDFLDIHSMESGGHMGFISKNKTPLGNRCWLDYAVLTFAEKFLRSK